MQSIFILALFGILYSTVAVITTMLSTSAMQQKLIRMEFVEKLFEDIELGVKKGYLGDNIDFLGLGITPRSGGGDGRQNIGSGAAALQRIDNFLSPYVSYSSDELLIDPWGTPYIMEMNYMYQTIYADSDGVGGAVTAVEAPIAVFILYSAGPNRVFGDNNPPNTFVGMQRFDAVDDDDIIHTFTTLEVSQEVWNHTKEVFDKMVSAVSDNYKQQYDLFAPTIESDYYQVVDFYDASFNWIGDSNATGCTTPLIHAWKDPSCNVTSLPATGYDLDNDGNRNLVGLPGFPVMYSGTTNNIVEDKTAMEVLGIDAEYGRMIDGLLDDLDLAVGSSGNGYLDVMDFYITDTGASHWSVDYSRRLNGSDIVSGL